MKGCGRDTEGGEFARDGREEVIDSAMRPKVVDPSDQEMIPDETDYY